MARNANSPQEASARPRRTPVAKRNRLDVQNQEPGYRYRIVNDTDDRIPALQEMGYEIVPDAKVGAAGNRRVDSASALGSSSSISVGRGVKAVVLRQRTDWYDEDQAVKRQQEEEIEQSMNRQKADYGTIKKRVSYSEG